MTEPNIRHQELELEEWKNISLRSLSSASLARRERNWNESALLAIKSPGKMKPETRNALLKAYTQLQQIIDDLYEAVDNALENDDFESASEPSH